MGEFIQRNLNPTSLTRNLSWETWLTMKIACFMCKQASFCPFKITSHWTSPKKFLQFYLIPFDILFRLVLIYKTCSNVTGKMDLICAWITTSKLFACCSKHSLICGLYSVEQSNNELRLKSFEKWAFSFQNTGNKLESEFWLIIHRKFDGEDYLTRKLFHVPVELEVSVSTKMFRVMRRTRIWSMFHV